MASVLGGHAGGDEMVDAGAGMVAIEDADIMDNEMDSQSPTDANAERLPIVVAFGWRGQILVSRDLGRSFCMAMRMHDDHDDLFRGGGYHSGLFLGAHAGAANRGSIFWSTNGHTWTPIHKINGNADLPDNPMRSWFGGVAYGNGHWVAVGGNRKVATSDDGLGWNYVGAVLSGPGRAIAFGNGMFVAGVDDPRYEHNIGSWYSSVDGQQWSLFREGVGKNVVFQDGQFVDARANNFVYRGYGVCLDNRGTSVRFSRGPDCNDWQDGEVFPDTITQIVFGEVPKAEWEPEQLPANIRDCLNR